MKHKKFFLQMIHALGVLLVLGAWRAAHAGTSASAQDKLDQLRSFIGEDAYHYVANGHLDKLNRCQIMSDRENPDDTLGDFNPLARLNAWSDVMMHDFDITTRESNKGIIAYMRDSLVTDAQFFQSAFYYYRWLQSQDQAWLNNHRQQLEASAPSPLNVTSDNKDLLSKALSISKWNFYQAFKIMALYGHDNLVNQLSFTFKANDCRWVIMDLLKPEQSQLYHDGAIPSLRYDHDTIERANRITDTCNQRTRAVSDRTLRPALHRLCNDQRPEYQGDYYHVITSSFLNCRGEIAWEREAALPGTIIPFMDLADASTRSSQQYFVRDYKYTRFKEEVDRADLPRSIRGMLNAGLDALMERQDPFSLFRWQWFKRRNPSDVVAMVRAILERYQFEMNFRVYQHQIAAKYARSQCSRVRSFGQAGEGLERQLLRDQQRQAREQDHAANESSKNSSGTQL